MPTASPFPLLSHMEDIYTESILLVKLTHTSTLAKSQQQYPKLHPPIESTPSISLSDSVTQHESIHVGT